MNLTSCCTAGRFEEVQKTDSLTALKKCGKTTSLPLAPGSEEPMWPMREK